MPQIKITPAELRSAADAIEKHATSIRQNVTGTGQLIEGSINQGHFQGHRAEHLISHYRQVHPTIEAWPGQMVQFASQLREAAAAFEKADQTEQANSSAAPAQPQQSDAKPAPGLPGDSSFWKQFVNKGGHNQNLVAGCTAYVASKIYVPWGPPLGNAGQWADNARAFMQQSGNERYGMSVDTTPQVGAVICWPGKNHVGIVTEVNGTRVTVAGADTHINAQGQWDQPWGTWINGNERQYVNYDVSNQNVQFIHMPWSEHK